MVLPLGVTHTLCTAPLCPTKRKGRIIGLKFHTMTVPSRLPEMAWRRFGLKHVVVTPSLWPLNERLRAGSATCWLERALNCCLALVAAARSDASEA